MFSADEDHQLEVLDEDECRRLLATAAIGRLAFTQDALPAIQPVSFAVHDGHVMIPTRAGSKLAAASRGAVVAFEVDSFDVASRTGWNVTVIGASRVVIDPAERTALEARSLRPWAATSDVCYIAISMGILEGRRIRAAQPGGGAGSRG